MFELVIVSPPGISLIDESIYTLVYPLTPPALQCGLI